MGKADKLSFREKKPSRVRRIVLFVVISLASAFAILIGGFAYIYCITPSDANKGRILNAITFVVKPGETAFKGRERMNILCVGLDMNHTDQGIMYTKNARSDTNIVISIDSEAQNMNLLSIPRDTWVEISPENGFDKMNSAYSYGGINLCRKCMENFLEITIDHYLIIKVQAAENLVNAIGGIEVDVEKDMDYDDNWGNLHIHLKKGPQLLNGQQAVGYGRFRHDEEGDWGRMRRQQQVINAFVRELKKPSNIMRMDKIARIIHESVETDLTLAELLDLGRLYKDFDRSNMKTGIIRGDDGGSDELSYIIPYEDEKKALVKRLLLRDNTLDPSEIRVGVLNGSKQEGEASELADALTRRGYRVMRITDADRTDYSASRVIDHMNNYSTAMAFKEFLGDVEYVGESETAAGNEEDITIIIGNDWKFWKERLKAQNSHKNTGTGNRETTVGREEPGQDPEPYAPREEYTTAGEGENPDPSVSGELKQPERGEGMETFNAADPQGPEEVPSDQGKSETGKIDKPVTIPIPSLILPPEDEKSDNGAKSEEPAKPEKKTNLHVEYQ